MKKEGNKGITLIALVLTIIIMLILAIITLNIVAEGGLIKKSKEAKETTNFQAEKEMLEIAIVGSYNEETKKIEIEKLAEELKEWIINENEDGTYTCISPNKNKFIISEKGEILEIGKETEEIINEQGLPREYQEVEYIESTGKQFIDTGIKDTKGWHAILAYEFTKYGATGSNWTQITGTYIYANGKKYRSYISIYINSNRLVFDVFNNYDGGVFNTELNKKYEIEAYTFSGNQYLIIDGIKYKQLSQVFSEHEEAFNICIFAQYQSNLNTEISAGKLYSAKYYDEDDNIIREFVPCYRKLDNEIGLYDLVENKFYTNQGTETFLKGKDI